MSPPGAGERDTGCGDRARTGEQESQQMKQVLHRPSFEQRGLFKWSQIHQVLQSSPFAFVG